MQWQVFCRVHTLAVRAAVELIDKLMSILEPPRCVLVLFSVYRCLYDKSTSPLGEPFFNSSPRILSPLKYFLNNFKNLWLFFGFSPSVPSDQNFRFQMKD